MFSFGTDSKSIYLVYKKTETVFRQSVREWGSMDPCHVAGYSTMITIASSDSPHCWLCTSSSIRVLLLLKQGVHRLHLCDPRGAVGVTKGSSVTTLELLGLTARLAACHCRTTDSAVYCAGWWWTQGRGHQRSVAAWNRSRRTTQWMSRDVARPCCMHTVVMTGAPC